MKKHNRGTVLRLPIPEGGQVHELSIGGQKAPAIYSAEWERQARELSDYIKALPLPEEENGRLVALMVDHHHRTAQEAYASGFRMGREYERGGYDGGPDGP